MSCYIYLYTFLRNFAWCLVFLETFGPWLKCQIQFCWFKQSLTTQHVFQMKNTLQGVEGNTSWYLVSPCWYLMWVFVRFVMQLQRPCWFSENQKWWQSLFCSLSEPFMRNGRPPTSHSMHSFLHQYTGSFKKPPLRRPHSVIGGTLGSFMAMPRNGSRLGETHTHTRLHIYTHTYTQKEMSSRRADGIQEQTGNVSQSWYFHPASDTHKPMRQLLPSPSAGLFLPEWQLDGGFSQTWRCFLCELIHHTGSVALSLILRLGREDDVGMSQSTSRFQGGGWGTAKRVMRWLRVQYDTEEQNVVSIRIYQPLGFLNV